MADAESISLEETNKIRISLGLKPLTDDKAPTDSNEKTAEDNYAKRREQERKEKETKYDSSRNLLYSEKSLTCLSYLLVLLLLELPSEFIAIVN